MHMHKRAHIYLHHALIHLYCLLQPEPLFCSLAIYDVRNAVKLSENFYFDINEPDVVKVELGRWYRA